jgi:hypothetical protein
MLVTDLRRQSLLNDAGKARIIQERIAKEGSSCHILFNDSVRWEVHKTEEGDQLELILGAAMVSRLARLLHGRILHDREFRMQSKAALTVFQPAKRASWKVQSDEKLVVNLTPSLAQQMQETIQPRRGEFQWPTLARFTLKVVPTEIKDQDGKVIEVIG